MTVIILGAGEGKRMRSSLPKVLEPLLGAPMISYILRTVRCFSSEEIIIVVSPRGYELTRRALGDEGVGYVIQPEALGTADAVKRCREHVHTNRVMILCGDVPLIRAETLSGMLELHSSLGAAATLLSTDLPRPRGYGRIVRNGDGSVNRIVEHKDASSVEKKIHEINSGSYIFEARLLFELLEEVKPSPITGEYYLTDVVAMLVTRGLRVEALKIEDYTELIGINDSHALKQVEEIFRKRLIAYWHNEGVLIENPEVFIVESDVKLASGTRVRGEAILRGTTRIGPRSSIGPNIDLEDTVVEGQSSIEGPISIKLS